MRGPPSAFAGPALLCGRRRPLVRGARAAAARGLLRRPAAAHARLRGRPRSALRSAPRAAPARAVAERPRRARADTLLGNLTVYEMLAYTSELKNPMNEPFERKAAKVEQVLQQLGLIGCRGVRIGSQLARGISGAAPRRAPALWLAVPCVCSIVRRLGLRRGRRRRGRRRRAAGCPNTHVPAAGAERRLSARPARAPQAASASA